MLLFSVLWFSRWAISSGRAGFQVMSKYEAERRLNAATTQMRQLNLQLLNTNAELWELQLFDEQFAAEVASVLAAEIQIQENYGRAA